VTGDTIAAIATATGIGGVGIVRVSGPHAIAIVSDMIGVAASELDRSVRLAWARDRAGARVDHVLAFAMRAPGSFTGEDVAELHGHGGELGLATLLAAVVERGARIAEPGEFTRRAVGNGKLDLVRAEALLEVIHAGSERAWRLARANLAGDLGERVEAIEKRGLAVLAEIEGRIDFPDVDLDVESDGWVDNGLCVARRRVSIRPRDPRRRGRRACRTRQRRQVIPAECARGPRTGPRGRRAWNYSRLSRNNN